jgi:hypothetical protein
MSENSDSNKLVYANKISKEESNELENENAEKHFEQKSTKNKVESEELKGILVEKDEIIKELKSKIKEQQNELKEKQEETKEQKIKMLEMQEVVKNQNEIIKRLEEKINEQNAKIEKDDFIINIYHKQYFLEIKNFFMKEGRQNGVNAIEQIEKYNSDYN